MNYQTPHAKKIYKVFISICFFFKIAFLLITNHQKQSKKKSKNKQFPQPPNQVKNKIPQQLNQQIQQKQQVNINIQCKPNHTIIDLIKQNQDLKNEQIEIKKDILNYKVFIVIESDIQYIYQQQEMTFLYNIYGQLINVNKNHYKIVQNVSQEILFKYESIKITKDLSKSNNDNREPSFFEQFKLQIFLLFKSMLQINIQCQYFLHLLIQQNLN
ncbi:unnamed protein product [Paramecium pentaurelia]|uniref:Transmembrane protein n=1 Tax=Paramecium pentaurelia TaxID=43138 RepID=A0A8S1UUQ8_9CILI|nr:unnamed protein product [Paramecium pentaurelia]